MNTELANKTKAPKEQHQTTLRPPFDLFENDRELLLVADVPGVKTENLSIQFEDGTISYEGVQRETDSSKVVYAQRFKLPEGIDVQAITAELRAGELRLHMPKAEAMRPRQIPVASA